MSQSFSRSVSPQAAPSQTAEQAPYEAPRVRDLGAWQALTLIYSVPFNGSPTVNSDSGLPSFGVWKNKF